MRQKKRQKRKNKQIKKKKKKNIIYAPHLFLSGWLKLNLALLLDQLRLA